jgi:hypothetical protein
MIHRRHVMVVTVCLSLVALVAASEPQQSQRSSEVWAFTGPWDSASHVSLRRNASALDVAVTGWIALDSSSAEPILPSPYPDPIERRAGRPARFAIVTS